MNDRIKEYYNEIDKEINIVYKLAERARSLGYDPVNHVEIPLARNMAERVEGLISSLTPQIKGSGVVQRIEELEKQYGKLDWRVALIVSLEVAQEKFCRFKDKLEAMETGIRVGLAYLSNGVVSSPLEGFTNLKIKKRRDGKEYFSLMFSGPIRSAGTTITCGSIFVADYIRTMMGYFSYDPEEKEVKRITAEIYDYHERVTNIQYLPSEQEIEFMISHLPLQIDGDPSEKFDVSNYKDLDRIETNKLRNGVCLVTGESLCQKAPKFWGKISKWYKEFNMEQWKFLEDFVGLQKKIKAKQKVEIKTEEKIKPDFTYIKDLVAGRPVLTHPLRIGGFRLRYGHSRTSGYSSMSMHPATMHLLKNYIGTGTQLKYERPGKSSAMAPCDTIEGPIVKLKNQNVIFIESEEQAKSLKDEVEEIIFLGDYLINYGEFFNRAHALVPCGYNEEWWLAEFEKKVHEKYGKFDFDKITRDLGVDFEFLENLIKKPTAKVNFDIAKEISLLYNNPLHPRWTYHWNDISKEQLISLLKWIEEGKVIENKIILHYNYKVDYDLDNKDPKRVLELIGLPHEVILNENVVIKDDDAKALLFTLNDLDLKLDYDNVLEILNKNSKIIIRDKSGTYIGARMGRPEKAKIRKLNGNPHTLFPVGEEGGRMRSFQSCLEKGKITAQFPLYFCEKCNLDTIYPKCEVCNEFTQKKYYCSGCDKMINNEECERHGKTLSYLTKSLPINNYFGNSLKKINLKEYPELIKGVRGTSNKDHTPENLCKGILRATHDVYVNKDGTIRYDMTEMPIVAFKPKEIGTTINKLKELGYSEDIYGKSLINEEQLIEIFPSDIILPACLESPDEGADLILLRVANFVDDLLEHFYKLPRFYNVKTREDLIGHIVLGLAPHTSAAIAGRIIGFSKTQGCFAHPMWHAAQRRDCEGDENCVMLLLDCLINFSKKYLPAHRGATQDAPLVITSLLTPSEVDDMVFDLDVCSRYPLELYQAAQDYKWPWDIKIEQLRDHLGKDREYYGFGFTHDVSDFNTGVRCSAYKYLPSMQEKVLGQMQIAELIRAVDEEDVARLVIERHFIRDIRGNLRKFSTQQFRCVNCNEKYRRPPLAGVCSKCQGKIIFTVAEGFIVKYLQPTLDLAEKFNLPSYLRQSLELTKLRIESMFGKDPEKQEGLNKWF
jgi:DNA polymerase II large subunit